MKRVLILATCLAAAASESTDHQPLILHPGTVTDLDDNTAGLLVVAGKAKYDKEAKLTDTTKAHERAADDRAKAAAVTPEATMAQLVAAAVTSALAAQAKAQAQAQDKAPAPGA